MIEKDFLSLLKQKDFKEFLLDNIEYALKTYDSKYKKPNL